MEKIIIAGSGPAGLTAAIYAARSGLEPLVLEGMQPGGQLTQTEVVENFPGFPDGIDANEFMARMKRQAERFGARYLGCDVEAFELSRSRGGEHRLRVGDLALRARTVILAMGARPRTLGIPGEEELRNRRRGRTVRLEVEARAGEELVQQLCQRLEVGPDDVYRAPGLLDVRALFALVDLPALEDLREGRLEGAAVVIP